jgi:hypothetical protein
VGVDFFFFLKWESGTSSELLGSYRLGRAMFQQEQYVGATIITANIAQHKYTDVWFENKDLQDKELGISHLYRGLEQLVVYGI